MDFEVIKFSMFTFWGKCTELTSCLGIAMYNILKGFYCLNMYVIEQKWTWGE